MSNSEQTPAGWDPDVFARIRAESKAERGAMSSEERERHDNLTRDSAQSADKANDPSDSPHERIGDVPGFDDDLNPFPLTRKPGGEK
ncbi:hypothetical protein [Nocardia inohanensis]|uniref:hypothetical protein n=1 Tax=Nocardia inohanensis TaxID=209246 RepID=UPI0012F786F2|nr:hypothetical protein [Nocardia inohanensis]